MNKYQIFYQKMINGELPIKGKFFCLTNNNGKVDTYSDAKTKVKIISPTQSSVEQAKSEIRDEKDINKNDELDLNQFGGSSKGSKKKTKSKPKPKQQSSKSKKKVEN